MWGDFNSPRDSIKRLGRNTNNESFKSNEFNEYIDLLYLVFIPLMGADSLGPIRRVMKKSRLDRFLILEGLIDS